MGVRTLAACAVSACALLSACSSSLRWQDAKASPFPIRGGFELARNGAFSRPAALHLVCSAAGTLHLLLLTKLPVPDEGLGIGHDDNAFVFVNYKETLRIKVTVAIREKIDEAMSSELSAEDIRILAEQMKSSTPERISVVGIFETGVFMVSRTSRDSVTRFAKSCLSPKAPKAKVS